MNAQKQDQAHFPVSDGQHRLAQACGVVVLGFGPQPLDFISRAAQVCGDDAILSPDVARMAGATPAWAARQMGHSLEQFLRTYARWIDGGQNAVEMAKLEAFIGAAPARAPGKVSGK